MSKWLARGAAAGAILAGVENLWAIATWYNHPISLILANGLLLITVGAVVACIAYLLSSSSNDFASIFFPIAIALAFVWLSDDALEASRFRGYPSALGLLGLVLVALVFGTIARKLGRRFSRTLHPELSFALSMLFVSLWLVGGRYVTREIIGSYVSPAGVAINIIFVSALAFSLWVQDRILATPRAPATSLAARIGAVCVGAALVLSFGLWSRSRLSLEAFEISRAPSEKTAATGSPNVVLVTIDTLRADRLSVYGYSRQTTPFLESFSEEALVFDNAISPSSWTLPAHASIFTGMLPARHGAQFLEEPTSEIPWIRAAPLHSDHYTLAEVLSAAGYSTAAFVANAAYLYRTLGVAQGFELYDDRVQRTLGFEITLISWLRYSPYLYDSVRKVYRPAGDISDLASEWLSKADATPFFLFVNYMDPHAPYRPPPPYATRFEGRGLFVGSPEDAVLSGERPVTSAEKRHYDAMYDGEVFYADRELEKLVNDLKELSLYDSTMIVVTSDHGEFLGEHGLWGHGMGPFQQVHRVPLLVKFPGSGPEGRLSEWVSTTDIFPTILQSLSLPVPEGIDGKGLSARGGPVFIEQRPNTELARAYGGRFQLGYRGVYEHPWKLVEYSDGTRTLFNLVEDPGESADVLRQHGDVVSKLGGHLKRYDTLSAPAAQHLGGLDEETRDRLRSLGYLR